MTKNILTYKPTMDYQKDYATQGTLIDPILPDISQPEAIPESSTPPEFFDSIKAVLPSLPEEMRKVVEIPLKGIDSILSGLGDDTSEVPPDRIVDIVLDDPDSQEPDEDDPFSSTIVDPVRLTVSVTPKAELARKQYAHDMATIFEHYASRLKKTLSDYVGNLAVISSEAGVPMSTLTGGRYYGRANELKDPNNRHLSDTVTRAQIIRDQKARLMAKLYDVDSIVLQIRACKIASELRARYHEEKPVANSTYLDIVSNTMLDEARAAYDKKYRESCKSLYKYLNSSVILLDECMKMHLGEMQAKAILIKKEGMDIK